MASGAKISPEGATVMQVRRRRGVVRYCCKSTVVYGREQMIM